MCECPIWLDSSSYTNRLILGSSTQDSERKEKIIHYVEQIITLHKYYIIIIIIIIIMKKHTISTAVSTTHSSSSNSMSLPPQRQRRLVLLQVVLLLVVCVFWSSRDSNDHRHRHSLYVAAQLPTMTPVPLPFRINCGGLLIIDTQHNNTRWENDLPYNLGRKGARRNSCSSINITAFPNSSAPDTLYCSQRFYNPRNYVQPYQYNIPVINNAYYSIRLHFAELVRVCVCVFVCGSNCTLSYVYL